MKISKTEAARILRENLINPYEFPLVMYYETTSTKKELKDGLSYNGTTRNEYDFTNGKHYYVSDKIYDGLCLKEINNEIFGNQKIIKFNKENGAKKIKNKFFIKSIPEGIFIQKISLDFKKPKRKEYGIAKVSPNCLRGENTLSVEAYIIMKNKNFVNIQNINPCDIDETTIYVINIDNTETQQRKYQIPDLYNEDGESNESGVFDESYKKMMIRALKESKMNRFITLSSTLVRDLAEIKCFTDIVKYKEISRKTTPKQRQVDKYNEMLYEIEDFNISKSIKSSYDKVYQSKDKPISSYYNLLLDHKRCGFLEKINDDTIVIRYYIEDLENNYFSEVIRVFIVKDKMFATKKNFIGEWVPCNAFQYSNSCDAAKFFVKKGTFSKRMNNILYFSRNSIKDLGFPLGKLIYNLYKHPILESLLKNGYDISYIDDYVSDIVSALRENFGKIDENEKDLFKALGVNKYQFDYALRNSKKDDNYIAFVKYILGKSNISDLDNNTFDEMISFAKEISIRSESTLNRIREATGAYIFNSFKDDARRYSRDVLILFTKIYRMYSLKTLVSKSFKKTMRNLLNDHDKRTDEFLENYHPDEYTMNLNPCAIARAIDYPKDSLVLFSDYLNLVESLNFENHVNLKFENNEELQRMHDELSRIYNSKKFEIEQKAFERHYEDWDKLTLKGDIYSVIYPKTPYDLLVEGQKQHHCVGAFINSVSRGNTSIFFLRKNEEIDKPLLTIEVRDGEVRQAHGFGNSNIEELEEANNGIVEFFNNWANAKKLDHNSINRMLAAI